MHGMLAYALYKRSKAEWITRYCQEKGSRPGQAEIDIWVSHLGVTEQARLLKEAEDSLLRFANTFLEEQEPEMRERFLAEELKPAIDRLETTIKQRTSFKSAIWSNVAATGIVIAGTVLLYFSVFIAPRLNDWFVERFKAVVG